MPAPSNTLQIEGDFADLADELASYIDNLNKAEPGAGVKAEVEPSTSQIREAEKQDDPVLIEAGQLQELKNNVMKQIVTKASVLNTAPDRDFTPAYNLLISLSQKCTIRDQLIARICQYLSEQSSTTSQTNATYEILSLCTILNILAHDSESRYNIFLAVLKVIKEN